MNAARQTTPLCATLLLVLLAGGWARGDAFERMRIEKLEAVHRAVAALAKERRSLPPPPGYKDIRAILHLHSAFSHDSRGKIEEIAAAAKKAGVEALLFTEHPADHYDFVKDGHRGLRDGILLIPGAETTGFLAYPKSSIKGLETSSPQEFADLVRRTGGRIFLCHLEERMDWNIAGLTGSEIYNTHADVKEERRLMGSLASPITWLTLLPAVQRYPQEAYAALQKYPADYLRRFDELCQKTPHAGVAGNDAHQNIGIVFRRGGGTKVKVEDALGKRLFELDGAKIPALASKMEGTKEGDVVLAIRLDPYEVAFRYVSTHLFARELSEDAVWEALEHGRAYVAFDWMAEATGFCFWAESAEGRRELGSRGPRTADLVLRGQSPLPGKWRLLHVPPGSGPAKLVIEKANASEIQLADLAPGHYRAEVWLTLAGEERPWILSNPIYVSKDGTGPAKDDGAR